MVVLHVRARAVATFHRRRRPLERLGMLRRPRLQRAGKTTAKNPARPVSPRLRPAHRSYAAPPTRDSAAWVTRDGGAACARASRCDLPPPKTPAGTPWHAPPPTLAKAFQRASS